MSFLSSEITCDPTTLSFEPKLNIYDLTLWLARLMEAYQKKDEVQWQEDI